MSDEGESTARKKMAHVIAIGIPSEEKPKGEKAPGPDEGLITAMDELLSAIESKDSVAMAEAFESAKALC